MKTLLLGTSVALGIALAGGSAYAADLPMAAAPVIVAAPEQAAGYISIFGGYAFANTVHAHSTATDFDVSEPFDAGYVIGGAVGTHLMPNLRGEVEVSYASHAAAGATSTFATGAGTAYGEGRVSTLYLLGNLWYDIDTGSAITPYLGGGIGAAVVMPNVTMDGTTAGYNTDAWAFAGQLGAGIKFAIADNISLDLGYRAKEVFNASLTGSNGASNVTNVNYIDQSVQLGLTFGF
jgi:opacity protein-like surface antigen